MSERKEGLYWCKTVHGDGWLAVEWAGGKWVVGAIDCQADVIEAGPRIPTPDEMEGWQVVPKEQTRRMAYAVEDTDLPGFCTSSRQSRHHDLGRQIYEANLKAAPKPGDV